MVDESVMRTLAGASAGAGTCREDEPTWQHSTVPSSQAAANTGSQWSEKIEGIFRASGFSLKVTA